MFPLMVLTYMVSGLCLAFVAEKPGHKSGFHAGYYVGEGKQSIIGNTMCKVPKHQNGT